MIARVDPAAMVYGDLLDDRQTQAAAAARRASPGRIAPVEALEHAAQVRFTKAGTVIPDHQHPPATA